MLIPTLVGLCIAFSIFLSCAGIRLLDYVQSEIRRVDTFKREQGGEVLDLRTAGSRMRWLLFCWFIVALGVACLPWPYMVMIISPDPYGTLVAALAILHLLFLYMIATRDWWWRKLWYRYYQRNRLTL